MCEIRHVNWVINLWVSAFKHRIIATEIVRKACASRKRSFEVFSKHWSSFTTLSRYLTKLNLIMYIPFCQLSPELCAFFSFRKVSYKARFFLFAHPHWFGHVACESILPIPQEYVQQTVIKFSPVRTAHKKASGIRLTSVNIKSLG